MSPWSPIQYRDFWDVPRIFLVHHQGALFLFDCDFDDELEDFPDSYKVYVLPELTDEQRAGSWDKFHEQAIRFVGEVPIERVKFDPSKQCAVDTTVLSELLARLPTG